MFNYKIWNFTTSVAKYELVKVIDFSDDCTLNCYQGAVAVVNGNMVEEVEAGEEKFSLILENYVFGILEGE